MPNISSRTPEGLPNRCRVCGAEVCVEPSASLVRALGGDAPCPNCGALLWFDGAGTVSQFRPSKRISRLARRYAAAVAKAVLILGGIAVTFSLLSPVEAAIVLFVAFLLFGPIPRRKKI